MASTYSSNLKIELIGTGEQTDTWGTTTNNNFGVALEEAIVGYGNPEYTNDANLTLTLADSNTTQTARKVFLYVTSTLDLTQIWDLIVPDIEKTYIIHNATSGGQSILVKTAAGTGVTIPTGKRNIVYVDGTNVMDQFNNVSSLTIRTALPVTSGGTGVTTSTGTGSVVLSTSPTLVTPLLGTPTSGTLTNCSGLPVSSGISGLAANVATFLATPTSANLAAAVTNETGSGLLVFATSPTLTTPALGTPSSGTLTSCTGLPIVAGTTGTLSVARGGTGVTTSTGSGNVVLSASPTFTGTVTTAAISATTVTASSNLTLSSDARLKKNVKTIRFALVKLFRLRGVMFTRIEDDTHNMGVIAQEVRKVVPEVVHTDKNGYLSVSYANLVGLLIQATKEAVVLLVLLGIAMRFV